MIYEEKVMTPVSQEEAPEAPEGETPEGGEASPEGESAPEEGAPSTE